MIRSHDLGNWTLQIKYPHLRDNGVYECQINTEPKMSLSYVLNVVGKHAVDDMTTCCDNCFVRTARETKKKLCCSEKVSLSNGFSDLSAHRKKTFETW